VKLIVYGSKQPLLDWLLKDLGARYEMEPTHQGPEANEGVTGVDAIIYAERAGEAPQDTHYQDLFRRWAHASPGVVVVLSSTQIHPPSYTHPGMVAEVSPARVQADQLSSRWLALEEAATEAFANSQTRLVLLRLAPVPFPAGKDYFSRLLKGGPCFTFAGYDPCLQFLSPKALTRAVVGVLEGEARGLYNVSPDGVVPLRKALALVGGWRLPMPVSIQFLARKLLAPLGLAATFEQAKRIRYPWTVSSDKLASELELPAVNNLEALQTHSKQAPPEPAPHFDDFGQNPENIRFHRRFLLRFLHDFYWRVNYQGLEHVPDKGRAVLVGVHRGFMPFDGTMLLYSIARAKGRLARLLIHPCLVKPPCLATFITKLGGIIATRKNADWVLGNNELLGIYPEGIQGAFTFYKNAYRLGKFGRDEYVKIALRNSAPIIPFVTVGSAEIFPIFGRIDMAWFSRYTGWPFCPITTPIPLPSKWHTQFLDPIQLDRYSPEDADDPKTVARIGVEIKEQMQQALETLRQRRKSVFFGSLFESPDEAARLALNDTQ